MRDGFLGLDEALLAPSNAPCFRSPVGTSEHGACERVSGRDRGGQRRSGAADVRTGERRRIAEALRRDRAEARRPMEWDLMARGRGSTRAGQVDRYREAPWPAAMGPRSTWRQSGLRQRQLAGIVTGLVGGRSLKTLVARGLDWISNQCRHFVIGSFVLSPLRFWERLALAALARAARRRRAHRLPRPVPHSSSSSSYSLFLSTSRPLDLSLSPLSLTVTSSTLANMADIVKYVDTPLHAIDEVC